MTLQFSRTKAAMERAGSMMTGMEREIRVSTAGRLPEVDTSARAMMLSSLWLYENVTPAVLDLRPCFVRNRRREEFVTLDDLVSFTSSFHATRNIQAFGIASGGRGGDVLLDNDGFKRWMTDTVFALAYDRPSP